MSLPNLSWMLMGLACLSLGGGLLLPVFVLAAVAFALLALVAVVADAWLFARRAVISDEVASKTRAELRAIHNTLETHDAKLEHLEKSQAFQALR